MKKRYLYLLLGILLFVSCKDDDSSAGETFVPGNACFSDTLFSELETVGILKVGICLSVPAPADYVLDVSVALENNVVEGKDYILASTHVPVKKGESQVYAEVELIDNRKVDPERFLELRIVEAGGGAVVAPSHCRIHIIDDESQCAVVFRDKETHCYESDETVTVPLCLEGTLSGNRVLFRIEQIGGTAVEGRDYKILSDMEFELTGVTDTAKLIIQMIDNDYNNEDRTLILEVTEVQGAQKLTSRSNCLLIIKDDDTGLYFGKAQAIVAETENLLLLPVRLTQPLSEDVEVKVVLLEGGSAIEGTDFTLEKTIVIPAGQDSAMLEFKPKYVAGASDDRKAVLSLEGCSNSKVTLDQGTCEVNIWDCDTKLAFTAPVYDVLSTQTRLMIPVSLEKALNHDVTFAVESGDSKIFMPETEILTIPAGELKVDVSLKVMAPALQKRPEVALSLIDVYGATAGVKTGLTMTFRLNKGAWSIVYVSSEENEKDGPATAAKLIDDNEGTFWHNKWFGATMSMPVETVINLNSDYVLSHLELVRRNGNSDTRKVEIYTTESQDWNMGDWTLQQTLEFGADGADKRREIDWSQVYPTARYVKVKIIQGNSNNAASLAELTLQGWLK